MNHVTTYCWCMLRRSSQAFLHIQYKNLSFFYKL